MRFSVLLVLKQNNTTLVLLAVALPLVVLADEGAGAIACAPRVSLGGAQGSSPGLEHLEEGGGNVVPAATRSKYLIKHVF